MRDDKVICNCRNITVDKMKNAIKNGAVTVQEVIEATGAGKSCGGCREYAVAVIESLLEK